MPWRLLLYISDFCLTPLVSMHSKHDWKILLSIIFYWHTFPNTGTHKGMHFPEKLRIGFSVQNHELYETNQGFFQLQIGNSGPQSLFALNTLSLLEISMKVTVFQLIGINMTSLLISENLDKWLWILKEKILCFKFLKIAFA